VDAGSIPAASTTQFDGRSEEGDVADDTESPGPSGIVDWLFRSRTDGRLVVGQPPNLRALVWPSLWVLARLVPAGRLRTALDAGAALVLAAWAVDELVRGVNPFRRLLGAVALLWLAARRLPSLP
jgi:hypothetical protein